MSNPLHIAHVITSLGTGGAETMLHKLVVHLDPGRFRSTVIDLTKGGFYVDELRRYGIPVIELGMAPGVPDPRGLLALRGHLQTLHPDIVQAWMYHGNLTSTLVAMTIRRPPPVLWNIRSTRCDWGRGTGLTGFTVWMNARLSRRPVRIISNSLAGVHLHQQRLGFSKDSWVVLPNGFDLDVYRPSATARAEIREELGVSLDAPLLGLVARFHPMKDHANALAAFSILRRQYPLAHLLLVGSKVDRTNPTISHLIQQHNLQGVVHCLGERHDLPRLYAAMDVALLSSSSESFPNVIGEAMACGVPCAVTDVGDAGRIVGDTGRCVCPGDPNALAGAAAELLRSKMESTAASVRQRIQDNYSLHAVVEQYAELYQSVSGHPKAQA